MRYFECPEERIWRMILYQVFLSSVELPIREKKRPLRRAAFVK